MAERLRVALVGGPMYDSFYAPFIDEVDVVVHADHPTLNRTVARLLAAGERIDLLATHGKYAPSQARWLTPLDQELAEGLAPRAVAACTFMGDLLCVPRNIDVRTLWWRIDRMKAAPATWSELVASATIFGFTGRESGLFGLFYELVASAGGAIFGADRSPTMTGVAAEAAVATLCELAARAPDDLPTWHYDDVDRALLDGRVDCAAAWPGGFAPIRRSAAYAALAPAPYLNGLSYSGCHGWAVPVTCGAPEQAYELLTRLCSPEFQRREADAGGIPARIAVLDQIEPVDEKDEERLAITRATIADGMLMYPPLARFPEVEDAGWGAINAAIRGEIDVSTAVQRIQDAAVAALTP